MLFARQVVRFGRIAALMRQHQIVRQIASATGPGDEVVDVRNAGQLLIAIEAPVALYVPEDGHAVRQGSPLPAEHEFPEIGNVPERL